MGDNWIVDNLSAALDFFSAMMRTLYDILIINPVTLKDGAVWQTVSMIWNGLLGGALSLMIILFFMNIISDLGETIRHGHSSYLIWSIIMLVIASVLIYCAPYLMMLIFWMGKELIDNIVLQNGKNLFDTSWVSVPDEIANATNGLSLSAGIIFWVVTLIAALVVMVSCFTIMLVVYGRLFNIYMHISLSPLAFSCMVSNLTKQHFFAFIRSFVGVVLEGVVIIAACLIFSAFASNYDIHDPTGTGQSQQTAEAEEMTDEEYAHEIIDDININVGNDPIANVAGTVAGTVVDDVVNAEEHEVNAKHIWTYIGQTLFLFILMSSMIKGADEFMHRKFGL